MALRLWDWPAHLPKLALLGFLFAAILLNRHPAVLLRADFWGEDGWLWYLGAALLASILVAIAGDWRYPRMAPTDFAQKAREFQQAAPGTLVKTPDPPTAQCHVAYQTGGLMPAARGNRVKPKQAGASPRTPPAGFAPWTPTRGGASGTS